jgi:Rrf2 family protein
MNNTRLATAIHILTILAEFTEQWVSSDLMAKSMNINPVIVRKELSVLVDSGFVTSHKGKDGGYRLNKNSLEISIADVYLAVKNSEVLGKKNRNPNPQCTIGKNINRNLDLLFDETEQIVVEFLKSRSLFEFTRQFH